MKHTIIALTILILTITAVIFNSFYVIGTMTEFYEKIKALPDTQEEFDLLDKAMAGELDGEWRELRLTISMSTHLIEVERLDEAITDLCSHMKNGVFEDFYAAVERAREASLDLIESEKMKFKNFV